MLAPSPFRGPALVGHVNTARDEPTSEVEIHESPIDDEPVVLAVARTVAAVTGTPPDRLPPLYDAVDTDTLETFVSSDRRSAEIRFRYVDRVVIVGADGTVTVREDAAVDAPPG